MFSQRARPRPLSVSHRKRGKHDLASNLTGGTLSPDVTADKPPWFPKGDNTTGVLKIGKYLLFQATEKEGTFKAFSIEEDEEFTCKVIPARKLRESLASYWQVEPHENIGQVKEIILGSSNAYAIFKKGHGDLHSYIRNKRRLRESEAVVLFRQIVSGVARCHRDGVVLRDLKLRKFVFKDAQRSQLRLDGLEDAYVLDDTESDQLSEKHGCPAYVSPEILSTDQSFYSGKAADIWSLGVILYTMLIGRYPFHDNDPSALFRKICHGQYTLPNTISSRARCLIRNLLRKNPAERLTADEILQHPWFASTHRGSSHSRTSQKDDQKVPDLVGLEEDGDYLPLAL